MAPNPPPEGINLELWDHDVAAALGACALESGRTGANTHDKRGCAGGKNKLPGKTRHPISPILEGGYRRALIPYGVSVSWAKEGRNPVRACRPRHFSL